MRPIGNSEFYISANKNYFDIGGDMFFVLAECRYVSERKVTMFSYLESNGGRLSHSFKISDD